MMPTVNALNTLPALPRAKWLAAKYKAVEETHVVVESREDVARKTGKLVSFARLVVYYYIIYRT